MKQGFKWYSKLEKILKCYPGSFTTHDNEGRVKSVYISASYGTAQPSTALRKLGFTGLDRIYGLSRYIESEEKEK